MVSPVGVSPTKLQLPSPYVPRRRQSALVFVSATLATAAICLTLASTSWSTTTRTLLSSRRSAETNPTSSLSSLSPSFNSLSHIATNTTVPVTYEDLYPYGIIQPVLHRQYLSHHSLHFSTLPQFLANMSASLLPSVEPQQRSTVVVVGVEYGWDVRRFADDGHHVIAFEPMPLYYNNVRERVDAHPEWTTDLRNVALGNVSDTTVYINYRNFTAVPVPATTLDALFNFGGEENTTKGKTVLHRDVAVMSVDVQGFELNVLQGGVHFLKHVQVLWFEMAACKPEMRTLFDLLDSDFVLFDFVPVGQPPEAGVKGYGSREHFLVNNSRPASFDGFYDWLCEWRTGRGYRKVQTDVVAVRRDVVSKIAGEMEQLGRTVCEEDEDERGEEGMEGGQEGRRKVECKLRWLDQGFDDNMSGGSRRGRR